MQGDQHQIKQLRILYNDLLQQKTDNERLLDIMQAQHERLSYENLELNEEIKKYDNTINYLSGL
jgi:hypothetical protein